MQKVFKTVNQQVNILLSRGMKFKNITKAKEVLEKTNYYNLINGTKQLYIDMNSTQERYIEGIYFEEVVEVLELDRNLRILFLKYILKIEDELRSHVAYEFGKNEGPYNWDNQSSFDCSNSNQLNYVNNLISKLTTNACRMNNDTHDTMLVHFTSQGLKVPIWVLVNTFEFGTLKSFYISLKQVIKQNIANSYYGLSFSVLRSFLEALNMFRNVCAHDFRILFYRIHDFDKRISDTNVHQNMKISTTSSGQYRYGKNDLFAVTIIFKYLLSENDFACFIDELNEIIEKTKISLKAISIEKILDAVGFPQEDGDQKNWDCIASIDK